MSDHIKKKEQFEEVPTYQYPFAAAPDIIRSHEKDAYFEGILFNHFSALLRRIYGARFLHTYTLEARTFSELLYVGLTTFIGNRTLGEEYCDIVQIEDDTLMLPAIGMRAGYIVTSILLPFGLTKILPKFRSRMRTKLEANLRRMSIKKQTGARSYRIQTFLLEHLETITSPSSIHVINLTVFYLSGAYYQLSKRLWGLRYIFTKRVAPSEARSGYEVLGVLLLLKISVQTWLHLRRTLQIPQLASTSRGSVVTTGSVESSPDPPTLSPDTDSDALLPETTLPHRSASVSIATHTPVLKGPRYDLRNVAIMPWIRGPNRKCTLCLEELKDPSAASCGHVFCWECIGDWAREKEKAECPLCRRELDLQHVLPMRG